MNESKITKNIAVFHLVRKCNNIKMLCDFLESYKIYSGGIEHDLIIIFKGFNDVTEKEKHIKQLSSFTYDTFDLSDHGLDITAYIRATQHFGLYYEYLCFLNSHTVVQDFEWLKKLYNNISRNNVGLVGATGSWQSLTGSSSRFKIAYAAFAYCLKTILSDKTFKIKCEEIYDVYQHFLFLLDFDKFPNVHIRTNGFMISASLMLENCHHQINSKYDAYRFESGKKGLSKTLKNKKLKLLMVGRDGKGYEEHDWRDSNIYMNNEQNNLLIRDNMTRKYTNGLVKEQDNLKELCWTDRDVFCSGKDWVKVANRRRYVKKVIRQESQLITIDNNNTNTRIIIFGANELGNYYFDWIKENTKNIEIVCFIDSYSAEPSKNGLGVYLPQYLLEHPLSFDYILISSNEYYAEMLNQLRGQSVDESIII